MRLLICLSLVLLASCATHKSPTHAKRFPSNAGVKQHDYQTVDSLGNALLGCSRELNAIQSGGFEIIGSYEKEISRAIDSDPIEKVETKLFVLFGEGPQGMGLYNSQKSLMIVRNEKCLGTRAVDGGCFNRQYACALGTEQDFYKNQR